MTCTQDQVYLLLTTSTNSRIVQISSINVGKLRLTKQTANTGKYFSILNPTVKIDPVDYISSKITKVLFKNLFDKCKEIPYYLQVIYILIRKPLTHSCIVLKNCQTFFKNLLQCSKHWIFKLSLSSFQHYTQKY